MTLSMIEYIIPCLYRRYRNYNSYAKNAPVSCRASCQLLATMKRAMRNDDDIVKYQHHVFHYSSIVHIKNDVKHDRIHHTLCV